MKKYTIITINFNNSAELRQTIESVLGQTMKDFEYIVIDGGATDGSVEVIKDYADHIDYWVSEPDKGVYNAMNKGLGKAHGEYVNFMNSGDTFHSPNVLEEVDRQIGDADILFGNVCNRATGIRYGGIKAGSEVTFLTLKKEILCHQADLTGMSSTQSQLHAEERQRVMSELFPPRILKDYDRLYTDEEMPVVTLLPELKKRGRVQKIVYELTRLLLKLT